MNLVFYKTGDVFEAEEKLKDAGVSTKVVPTPVQDKAYCGVCLRINTESYDEVIEVLKGLDYITIE